MINVTTSWLYSSGPVSHGLYASGNGTIYGSNLQVYSGGQRSSSFSGGSPAGSDYVKDSVAHAASIGSATFYVLGSIYARNVISVSEKDPVVFFDGAQSATLVHCDCTAGLLGGVAMFSSQARLSGASLNLTNTKFTTTGLTMPALWFGNVIADVALKSTQLKTASGVLVVANFSQITQDFDYYASYLDNNNLQPAEVSISVSESDLVGDLVVYNGSYIRWSLEDFSTWSGTAYSSYGKGFFDIDLDSTSNWTMTANTIVQNLTDTMGTLNNIQSRGYNLYFNSTVSKWLRGKTIGLPGGGMARPIPYTSGRVQRPAQFWMV